MHNMSLRKIICGVTLVSTAIGFSQSFNQDASAVLSDVVVLSKGFVSPAADASVYQSSSG